nr:peptidase domain-containing ABC transporter [Exiguobacterium sp. s191]
MQYPYIRQPHLKDCGITCLAMINKFFGKDISVDFLRKISKTDKSGTSALGIMNAARSCGLISKTIFSEKKVLSNAIPLPAIAHLIINNFEHYVVVYEVCEGYLMIADPQSELKKMGHDEFHSLWTGHLILFEPDEHFAEIGRESSVSFFSSLRKMIAASPKSVWNFGLKLSALSILLSIFSIASTFYINYFVESAIKSNHLTSGNITLLIFFVLLIVSTILQYSRGLAQQVFEKTIMSQLFDTYLSRLISLPMSYFENKTTGEIFSTVFELEKLKRSFSSIVFTLYFDLTLILVSSCLIFYQSRLLFFYSLILVPLYSVTAYRFNSRFKTKQEALVSSQTDFTSSIYETILGMETIKSLQLEERNLSAVTENTQKLVKSQFELSKSFTAQTTAKNFITIISQFVLMLIGINQVINGGLTLGSLMMFNTLFVMFNVPFQNIFSLNFYVQSVKEALKKVNEVYVTEMEQTEVHDESSLVLNSNISFKDVMFSYGYREPVISKISVDFELNKKIAIVGESGSGKSTLVKLLMKFHADYTGEISVGDRELSNISTKSIRSAIGYVPQDSFFFNDTVLKNLDPDDQASDLEIEHVLLVTESTGFVNDLSLGVNTYLEENAQNISTGQKQRLALARALIKKQDILILDEATSNIDVGTENRILEQILRLENNTVIMVTHRINSIVHFDQIIVMDEGEIVGKGTHAELKETNAVYQRLLNNSMADQEHLVLS